MLVIFVAFLLFGLLMTIRMAFTFGVDIAGADRLVLIHKVSLIMPLPVSYLPRLQTHAGRGAGHPQLVVRRHLPGSVELLRADRRGARAVHDDLPGVQAAAGPDEGVARRPPGRGRRHGPRRRGSTGRSASGFRFTGTIWQPKGSGRRRGSSTSSASTTAAMASTRRSSSSGTTTSTRTAGSVRAPSAGTSSRSPTRRQPMELGARIRRHVRQLGEPKRRPRPRRDSSRASPSRSATSASS